MSYQRPSRQFGKPAEAAYAEREEVAQSMETTDRLAKQRLCVDMNRHAHSSAEHGETAEHMEGEFKLVSRGRGRGRGRGNLPICAFCKVSGHRIEDCELRADRDARRIPPRSQWD